MCLSCVENKIVYETESHFFMYQGLQSHNICVASKYPLHFYFTISRFPLFSQSKLICASRYSCKYWGFPVAQKIKNPLAVQETWVWSLGQEVSLEK